jgi:hypothetical protein
MADRPLTPDDRARLACSRASSDSNELRELLSMLALWPGQEKQRETSLYVPNFNNKSNRLK